MAKREVDSNNLKDAQKFLVGGVNSPVRAFGYAGCKPLLIKKAQGSKVYDYQGNRYIDYILSWGSLILGHAPASVTRSVERAISGGLSFGLTNKREVELARIIIEAIPGVEKIRFVNSGTEAVISALRLARGFSGRKKIVIFDNSYHGHADYLLAAAGSGMATLNIAKSAGIPNSFLEDTIVAKSEERAQLERIFKEHGREIAVVLFEPIRANYGLTPPDYEFLKFLRTLTRKYDSLLIADEVITGFRLSFGSFSEKIGLDPDIICLGKIIGGGLPIGAYAAKTEIMQHLAPLGDVYQASTFSGNPIVMQAGLSTLRKLKRLGSDYKRIEKLTKKLTLNIKKYAKEAKVDLDLSSFGSMFSLKFQRQEDFRRFFKLTLEEGVLFVPSEYETNFLSFAHTEGDINKTLRVIRRSLKAI